MTEKKRNDALNWRSILSPGDVWQCLEVFSVVTTGCVGVLLASSG